MKWFWALLSLLCVQYTVTAKVRDETKCSAALKTRTGSFKSPKNRPGQPEYPNNAKCKWNITLPEGGNVTITFSKFHTEACCDYVKLTNEEGKLINQYSGTKDPFSITIKYEEAHRIDITFKSDLSVARPGFEAYYVIHGKIKPESPKLQVIGVGHSLMEAFLKMASALTRIINAVLGSPKIHDTKNILIFKSELYQGLKEIEKLKSVMSPALTKDENIQINMVLKHLNQKAKAAIWKLEPRLSPIVCSLPKEVGPCRALFKRYYYNMNMSTCVPFDYGGCQGNGNNFEKIEDCQKLCNKTRKQVCPPGQKVFRCAANPCEVTTCPAYGSTSTCKPNFCQGCHAFYYDQHNIRIPSNRCHCQLQQSLVECVVDPCQNAKCSSYPDAKCRTRRCDSCVAEFVALNGTIITKC